MANKVKTIGVLTSGGDAPGMKRRNPRRCSYRYCEGSERKGYYERLRRTAERGDR